MLINILQADNTNRVLHYPENHPFLSVSIKDKKSLNERIQETVSTISPGFKGINNSYNSTLIKDNNIFNKLPNKMRIKNSSTTSKELQDLLHSYLKDKNFKGAFGGLTIRSQHSFIKLIA